ncbi:MAG: isoprenyl transferase [Bacteroidaceae bacterium]|nr:isoprenyl transferase [Bacteroidaceae bacterium]MBR5002331.1 isoprenyl transferase [Bacteroidaceae bacterium]
MSLVEKIDLQRVPRHIAIIMDGNGRWAKERNLDRSQGHRKGLDIVHEITNDAADLGVECLTLYAFSTENWNRPQAEVDALMALVVYGIERETPGMIENGVRLSVIGDTSRMPLEVQQRLQKCIEDTAAGTRITLNLALSYSARWEITHAAQQLAQEAAQGIIKPEEIDDKMFASRLTTAQLSDPDLLIRTGGEQRISNFLLWQLSYAEFYFTDEYWPDFNKESLCKAIIDFQNRERRYGKTSEQVQSNDQV